MDDQNFDKLNDSFASMADFMQQMVQGMQNLNSNFSSFQENLAESIQSGFKENSDKLGSLSNDLTKKVIRQQSTDNSKSFKGSEMFGGFDTGSFIVDSLGFEKLFKNISHELKNALKISINDPKKAVSSFQQFSTTSFKQIGQTLKNVFKNPFLILLVLIYSAVERFLLLEKAAEDFRKQVGLAGDQTRDMERMAQRINVQYENMGVSIEGVYKTMSALVEEFGRTDILSEQIVKNTSLFSSALGISEKASAGFSKNISMISGLSLDTASNFEATAFNLAKASGVAPVKVIEDMASASDDTLVAFAGMPDKLLSASIYARRLGTDINELSKSTRELLDFQSSISSEMEASTLLGQTINLQRARQLRFAGDIAGANEEILKRVEQIGDFNKLNVFQQEAIAKATGKSVAELQKQMMLRERSLKYGVELFRLDEKAQEALANANNLNQDRINQLVRESDIRAEQTKMLAELTSLGTNLAQIFVPIVTIVATVLTPILKVVGALIRSFVHPIQQVIEEITKMSDGLGKNVDIVGSLIAGATWLGNILGQIVAFTIKYTSQLYVAGKVIQSFTQWIAPVAKTTSFLTRNFNRIVGFAGMFTKVFAGFAKAIPVIGWVIFGIEAIIRLAKSLIDIWTSSDSLIDKLLNSYKAIPMAIIKTFLSPFKMLFNWIGKMFGVEGMGESIIGGFESIVDEIYNIMLWPFKKVWTWLSDTFFGKSPSKLALNILKGITAVQGMIMDVLLAPFRMVKDFISETFGSLFGGGNKADISLTASDQLSSNLLKLSESVDKLTSSINSINGENMISVDNVSTKEAAQIVAKEVVESDNNVLIVKLDELIGLMRNGAIAVNLDGRKVSQQLARKVY